MDVSKLGLGGAKIKCKSGANLECRTQMAEDLIFSPKYDCIEPEKLDLFISTLYSGDEMLRDEETGIIYVKDKMAFKQTPQHPNFFKPEPKPKPITRRHISDKAYFEKRHKPGYSFLMNLKNTEENRSRLTRLVKKYLMFTSLDQVVGDIAREEVVRDIAREERVTYLSTGVPRSRG